MGWIVAVAPPSEATSAAEVRELLQACTEALPEGDACVIAGPRRSVDWRAVARCADAGCAAVTVSLEGPEAPRTRTLGFGSDDPMSERFRALGFAIAALVPPHPAAPAPSPPVAVVPPPSVSGAAPPPEVPRVLLSLSFVATTGAAGRLFPGVEARGAVRLRRWELAVAAGSTTERGEGTRQESSLSWLAAGVRVPVWSSPRGKAFARVEGLSDRLHLERYDAEGVAHTFRWSLGGRLGLDAEIVATERSFVLAFLGLGARATGREPTNGTRVGELDVVRVDAGLGFGTRF